MVIGIYMFENILLVRSPENIGTLPFLGWRTKSVYSSFNQYLYFNTIL